jgi:hypothetical protein
VLERELSQLAAFPANLVDVGIRCFPVPGVINRNHNQMDAASLGLAIRDCKERGLYQLAYAPTGARYRCCGLFPLETATKSGIISDQIGQPGEENASPTSNQNQAGKKAKDRPSANSSISSNVGPTPPNASNSDQKNNGFCKRYKDEFEVAAIVAGIILLVINILVYCEMIRATNTTKESVRISRDQLIEMRQQRINDERAWVVPYLPEPPIVEESSNFVFKVQIKNTGKTPAVIVGCTIGFAPDTNSIPKGIPYLYASALD